MDVTVNFTVNSKKQTVTTDEKRPVLDVIREDIKLTGTKYGCGEGMCRACTVLIDGRPVTSCITPISSVNNKAIVTIEGLAQDENLHPLQESFQEEFAMQCGYCTPGMILTAAALLKQNPDPTVEEIGSFMNGNICRCGGYPDIIKAILRAAREMKGASHP